MLKYLSIIGTRPQYIKVLDNLENHVVCDTRQHYDGDMSDIFVKQLKIKPKYNLGETELGPMYEKCLKVIDKENPDIVIVYGDTRSTLAGALAAKFRGRTLAHVEAGMRSGDMAQPEEVVRILVDRISDYLFCANTFARDNLTKENMTSGVYVVGDCMWDNLKKVLPLPKSSDYEKYDLLTVHRQNNTDNEHRLRSIFEAVGESGWRTIMPLHPRTKKAIQKFKIKLPRNIEIIEPQGYKQMISLETNCRKIITDSGGVQREGYWFMKPVIILRDETEWQEIVQDRWAVLVGANKNLIIEAIANHNPRPVINKPKFFPAYGAKEKIKEVLK